MSVKNIPIPVQGFDDHDSFLLEPQYGTLFRNVRSNRRRIERSPGATLMAPPPTPGSSAGTATVVGTFTKPTTAGSQTFTHALGVTPVAMILISTSSTSLDNTKADFNFGYGMTDGTTSRSASMASADGADPGQTARNYASAALTVVRANATLRDEAQFTSWNASSVTLNWTTVANTADIITYMLIGNAALSAKVLEWTLSTAAGNQSVTGAGFLPQLVIHITADRGVLGILAGATFGIGAMSASSQFSVSNYAQNGSSAAAQAGAAAFATSAMICGTPGGSRSFRFAYVSLDADGFTISKQNLPSADRFVASLCLAGFDKVAVGSFVQPTGSAPKLQHVTGLGFEPLGGMFHSTCFNSDDQFNGLEFDSNLMIGAFDSAGNSFADNFFEDGQAVPVQCGHSSTTSYVWSSHEGGGGPDKLVQRTQAKLKSVDTDGFTLNWTKLSGASPRGFYWAVRTVASAFESLGVIRNYSQPYVGTGTTVAEKLLMLTSKSAFIYTPSTSSTGIWTSTSEVYTGTDTQRFSIVNTQSIAAWSQGVNNIRQWDGTTFSALVTAGTDHAARALIAFADRIVSIRPLFGGIDHATQIRWCISGGVNNWSGAGSGALEIIETSQDPLVTGFVLGDRAYLAKQREIIELISTGSLSPVFGTAPRVRGMGILAPHSVGLAEQFAFWLGPDDIYMWDGSTLTPVGDRVYNTVDALIDYNTLDMIQGAVWTPDSLYLLVVPPFLFIYDYRRDIWYQDDTVNFQAIGVFKVGTNFTADIDHSEFIVIGDSFVQTVRLDQSLTSYLGAPIDSYWTTKDYTAEQLRGGQTPGFVVSLWDINSLRELRFQSNAGNIVEVGVSTDRGVTWQTTNVTTNSYGVGVAWFQMPFSQIRFRFRDFETDAFEIHGTWGVDFEGSGYQFP